MKKEVKNGIKFIVIIFWVFVIGSIFGFFAEMLYSTMFTRALVIRKGLIYGPFIQIYGLGAVAYYLLISKVQDPKEAFISGMIMGGILEYLGSFFQEILFGTISWDYSNMFFNLNGRTCLLYCFYWGIIAVAYLKIVYPWFKKISPLLERTSVKIITVILMIFMAFDITISCMAAARQEDRRKEIPARNKIDEFLDKVYTDDYLDMIYNNKKNVS